MSKGITNSMEMDQPFYVRRKAEPVPFTKFLFNSEEGTVMGRTGSSWGKKSVWVNFNGPCGVKGLKSWVKLVRRRRFNTNTSRSSTFDYTGVVFIVVGISFLWRRVHQHKQQKRSLENLINDRQGRVSYIYCLRNSMTLVWSPSHCV